MLVLVSPSPLQQRLATAVGDVGVFVGEAVAAAAVFGDGIPPAAAAADFVVKIKMR